MVKNVRGCNDNDGRWAEQKTTQLLKMLMGNNPPATSLNTPPPLNGSAKAFTHQRCTPAFPPLHQQDTILPSST